MLSKVFGASIGTHETSYDKSDEVQVYEGTELRKYQIQHARGSEITTLQHTNATFHENVFVENGLTALVTSYHKG